MNGLANTLLYEIWILLIGFAGVVTYQILTRRVSTRGLLRDKMGTSVISPGRLQLLMFTIGGAAYYLLLVLGRDKPGEFPEIPNEFLLALGGSHAFYLGGKLYSLLAPTRLSSTSSNRETR